MRSYRFLNVDVFTESRFGGNQLAVFVDGSSLDTEEMQNIANEMNFSETTFIVPPEKAEADWKVRIFTPRKEIRFSGHPTLGTAYVLAQEAMIDLMEPLTTLKLEMGIGVITVELEITNQKIGKVIMQQPKPTYEYQGFDQSKKITDALGINFSEIEDTGFPVEVVSTGDSILFVPIKSLRTMETMKPKASLLEELCIDTDGVYVLSTETVQPKSTIHSRIFLPHEESATGFTSGPLAGYLIKNEVVVPKPLVKIISEQGYEIGRPSTVHTEIGMDNNKIVDVRIGGHVVLVAGNLFIE